jgi:hypothetical protein
MRRVALLIPIALVALSACRPPAVTQTPARVVVGQSPAAALPEPGVYILQRVKGMALPADLKPPEYDPRRGSNFFERVIGGWLYLTSDGPYHRYQTIICADLVDSTGRAPETMDRGPSEGRYWAAGGRVYFSVPITDAMPDSSAVRVHGDTVEFVRWIYVLDRTAVQPRNLIPAYICPAVRASLERDARTLPSGD